MDVISMIVLILARYRSLLLPRLRARPLPPSRPLSLPPRSLPCPPAVLSPPSLPARSLSRSSCPPSSSLLLSLPRSAVPARAPHRVPETKRSPEDFTTPNNQTISTNTVVVALTSSFNHSSCRQHCARAEPFQQSGAQRNSAMPAVKPGRGRWTDAVQRCGLQYLSHPHTRHRPIYLH